MFGGLRIGRRRIGVSSVALAMLSLTLGSGPALAATSPFSATFKETTTFRPCPAGVPAGAMCYTGVGHGPTTPPVPPDPNATENFAGFVVFSASTGCGPDYNAVTITTYAGTLFLTTQGIACATGPASSVENGTWTAHGGTGIFEDASGSGPVTSVGTFNPDGTVSSTTTYAGMLNLQHSSDQGGERSL